MVTMLFVVLLAVATPQQNEQGTPIRLRDKAKLINEVVLVRGITGKKLDDLSQSTRLYTLVDDFGDSIKVRTSQPWPSIGVTFRVRGTIIYDGRLKDYILVEADRVSLAGQVQPTALRSPTNLTATPETKPSEENRSDTLVIIGVSLVVLAGIALMLLATAVRRRRRAEQRRRQREEVERASVLISSSAASVLSPTAPSGSSREQTISMDVGPGVPAVHGAPKLEAVPPRSVTREAWGRLVIVDGPGTGTVFPLMGNKTAIGRDAGIDASLTADDTVSRIHATLVRSTEGKILFIDQSRNGSRVNGRQVHMNQVEVTSGARIEVGLTSLEFTDFRSSSASVETPLSRRPTIQVSGLQASSGAQLAEIVVTGGPDASRRFPVTKRIVTIGRMDDRDIQLTDPKVSRKHATVSYDGEAFVLQNESANGTFVDDMPVNVVKLKGNEKIKMGDTILHVEEKAGGT